MNILLWVLQVLLALHTATGAVWKFSHSSASVPSLKAIPQGVWLALSGIELLCCVALLLPLVSRRTGRWAPLAACAIAAEMLLFVLVHLVSSQSAPGEIVYWLVVASLCAFLAYGRFVRAPIE